MCVCAVVCVCVCAFVCVCMCVCVCVPQDTNPPKAQLFERASFSGKRTDIQDDIPNLMTRHSLNRAASIRVLGGA